MNTKDGLIISHRTLLNFVTGILERHGVPGSEAACIAETLVSANLRGVDTHGVMRLPIYLKRLHAGSMRRASKISKVRETSVMVVIDGHNSFGQVVASRGMELAMEKAKNAGIGVVGVRNSEHFGAAAFFAMMALKKNMIGIVLTNTTPMMAPTGGVKAIVGNNPIAIAIPTGKEPPIVVDIATSVAAMGKIHLASQRGEKIPIGWGRDKFGAVTDDPNSILQGGSLSPLGEHKGYGLSVAIDVLAGVLTGAAFSTEVLSIYRNIDQPNRCGHFIMAIRVSDFLPISAFKRSTDKLIREIKKSPKAQGVSRIFLPGEIEFLTERKRMRQGIPIEPELVMILNELAVEAGVKPLREGA